MVRVHGSLLILIIVLVVSLHLIGFYGSKVMSAVAGEMTVLPSPSLTPKLEQIDPENFYAPILLYHHIALKRPQNSYYVSPAVFAEQMKWLQENDYHIVSLDDFYQAALGDGELPSKPVVITFDDSTKDQYQNGFPILKKYGVTATFFIKLNNIGEGGMTWGMLREMVHSGMTLGSHSVNHDNMAQMDSETLAYEFEKSKSVIEKETGVPVKYFAYPGGAYNSTTVAYAKYAGYLAAMATRHKVWHKIERTNDLYTLARIHIDDEMPTFIDWVQGKNLR